MRRSVTLRLVWAMTAAIVICCVVWAVAVQYLVPDVCSYPTPPPNAQFVHCP